MKELRPCPLPLAILEKENLVVATGSSPLHPIHDFTDRNNRSFGSTTGTALHAEKQNFRLFQRTRAEPRMAQARYWLRCW